MASPNFKVIVIGGGPVGLTAAHALSRANIDFILLESRPTVIVEVGSDLILLPMGMRLLGQLGLLDALNAVSVPLTKVERYDHQGNTLGQTKYLRFLEEK
jgi:2-polyprenyl-6-methoxyphenol hydroxylase-like FAD-dependent oxidoreductase